MNKFKIIIAALVCASMATSLAGCSKSGDESGDNTSSSSSTTSGIENSGTEDGGTGGNGNNSGGSNGAAKDPTEYAPGEEYIALGNAEGAAKLKNFAFYDGEGGQFLMNTEILTSEPAAGDAIYIEDVRSDIASINIGGKSYKLEDLVKDQSKGLEIVRLFAKDFGLNRCNPDGVLIERLGDVSNSDNLRELYSYREDFEEYTACAYYFDVKLGNYDAETYEKYEALYEAADNTDNTGFTLNGKLGIVLYYDTKGHDYFYSIVISAPSYYNDEANFKANMNSNERKDITNCYIERKDGVKIGMANNFTIMCATMYEV